MNKFLSKNKKYFTKRNTVLASLTFILLLILPVIVILSAQQKNLKSNAAGAANIEVENGTIAGSVAMVNDTNASGGKYMKFGSAQVCGGPLTITQGGNYSGCYESTNVSTPAVQINTTSPVTLDKATIRHKGEGIVNMGSAHLTVTNSTFLALDPGIPANQRNVYLYKPTSFVFENNSLSDGHGILINGDNVAANTIRIRYNTVVNIGRYAPPSCCIQFVQFDKVLSSGAEIAWNKVTNVFGQSNVEDVINMYKSNGTQASPIRIHHNLIDGAFPPTAASGYSGGGIIAGDAGGSWITISDNRVLSTINYGVAISGGHDNHLVNNRVVSDNKAADGTAFTAGNVGFYVWNYSTSPDWGNNNATNNASGWLKADLTRNDWWIPDCNPIGSCTGNTNLPNPITASTEQAERDGWAADVVAAGLTIGPIAATPTPL